MRAGRDPTSSPEDRRDRLVSVVGAVLAVLVVLLATFRTDLYERERWLQKTRLDVVRHASILRARIEGALNSRLHLAHGLGAYAKSHPNVAVDDFTAFAEGLTQTNIQGIRSLQLAPGAVVSHVYPMKGNEAVVGHDLLGDARRREAVERTIRNRLFVVAGPVKLIQGGSGLIARLPLFTETDRSFWGFATVVLDLAPILTEGGLYPAMDPAYLSALRGKDALGADGEVFFGDSKLFTGDPVLMNISLPHGTWQLAVLPQAGWPQSSPFTPMIWTAGALLAFFAGAYTYTRISEPARLRRQIARATRALAESEEQFRRVATSASDAIVSCNSAGIVVFWNPAAERIFDYPATVALGQSLTELVVPAAMAGRHRDIFSIPKAESRVGRVVETTARRRDGSVFPVELTLAQWSAGDEQFFTAIVRDVTDRRAAEQAQATLRERYYHAQKMEAIGRLASGAAHEFNNTLNSLLANAEAALTELPEGSSSAPPLYEVLNCGWRAAEIVRQLLVFSEKNGAEQPQVSPYAAVNQLLSRLRAQLPPNITLSAELMPVPAAITLEFDQFCHMVWNLFMNACRAMVTEGGMLTVGLDMAVVSDDDMLTGVARDCADTSDGCARMLIGQLRPGRHVRLTVSDTGSGMDQETLSRIFEPFFTTAAVGNGTGLGLSVAHGVVQSNGGAILVASQRGHGTRFQIFLPSLDLPQEPPAAAEAALG